ncbi:MAG: hypothetical protein SNJ61_13080, partial [Fimbriimonadaceae bacterium]
MKHFCRSVAVVSCLGMAAMSLALINVVTDRFGYTGTVWRFDTLADAQAFRAGGGPAPTSTISIGDRDLALRFRNNHPSLTDRFIFMGSWWYTTVPNPPGAGWGNTRGNTGIGFAQLFDVGGVGGNFTSSFSAGWSNWTGSHFDTFSLSLTGANAG